MPFSRESVPKFGTLFLIRLKYLSVRPFVKKKIKELLLIFLRSEDDYVEVSRTIQYNRKFYCQLTPWGLFRDKYFIKIEGVNGVVAFTVIG